MYPTTILWVGVLILQLSTWINGLLGYDCAASNANITTITLNKIGDCNIPEPIVNETTTYMQLLQLLDFGTAHVQLCRVEIFREVHHCGMFSHTGAVSKGIAEYIQETTRDACKKLHETGRLNIGSNIIDGIKLNATSTFTVTLAGTINSDGDCDGTQYTDPYGTWDDVIVQGSIKITLMDYWARTDIEKNILHLQSGNQCALSTGHCMDVSGAYTYWDVIPQETCRFNRYGVLYEGYSSKLQDLSEHYFETIYTVKTDDITFALTSEQSQFLCGYQLVKTQHPKLYILEGRKEAFFSRPKPVETQNLDLFTYVNSKFVYVERYMRTQINGLYKDVMLQRCKLEREILRNAQTLALIRPEEFAFNFQKEPGYTAIITGEVIRLIKCIPVEVKILSSKRCYQELPVKKGNSNYFLMPKTHILKSQGTEIPCNNLIPPMYEIEGIWYKVLPFLSETTEPYMMKPLSTPTWTYKNPGNLAKQGIYSEEDIKRLNKYIMSPFDQPSIVNNIIRAATGEPTDLHGLSWNSILDEKTLEHIAASTWNKLWIGFSTFGTFSAGILGMIITMKIMKMIIDTVIHVFALHTVYGWSPFLLVALWDSATNLLLHLNKRNEVQRTKKTESTKTQTNNDNDDTNDSSNGQGQLYPLQQLKERDSNGNPDPPAGTSDLKRPYGLNV